MSDPRVNSLLDRVRSLPAGAPLLARLTASAPSTATGPPPAGAPSTATGPPPAAVYLVGGAVRDLLLGQTPYDLDLVVEGDAAAVASALGGQHRAHDRFGTATVTLNGFSYDIATARRETYARPGALPDVVPATLAEDLHRRDFTVNALAIGLTGPDSGRLRSVPHGLEDLADRRLRVMHDASFVDDPTRMLRLVRYASRLRFSIEAHTRALLRPADLGTVSGARIGNELRLVAREADPVAGFATMRELQLDRAIHPDFGLRDDALARRALELLPADARRDRLVLAAAALGVPPREREPLLDHLAFEALDRDAISAAAGRADAVARALAEATTASAIAGAVAGADPELVALAGALGPSDQARAWLADLRHVTLEIDGDDLLSAGVPEGPSVGRGLRAALAAKLDGRVRGARGELEAALEAARGEGD